jgi:hypothetical protein
MRTCLPKFVATTLCACALALGACSNAALSADTVLAPSSASQGLQVLALDISEQRLRAGAKRADAAVTLTLQTGDAIERFRFWPPTAWLGDAEIDAPRHCTVRVEDRKGAPLIADGTTFGATADRSTEQFEADLTVARGLAEQLAKNPRAYELYRWELRDLARTARDLIGLRGPVSDTAR